MSTATPIDAKRYERKRHQVTADAYKRIRDALYESGPTNAERSAILSLLQHEINADMQKEIDDGYNELTRE